MATLMPLPLPRAYEPHKQIKNARTQMQIRGASPIIAGVDEID
jgi:hypothetical protein